MKVTCPWCRSSLTTTTYRYPEVPEHGEPGHGGTCPGSYSDQNHTYLKALGDIRYRNGWDRRLPAHP